LPNTPVQKLSETQDQRPRLNAHLAASWTN
jgi:hypothetical protein